jgi:hypothetical protein
VKRYSDEPLVILGVNTDGDKDMYRSKADEMGVTWRSAWQGSTSGPITSQYRVQGYPTMHVIGPDGRLRYMNVRGKQIEAAVEKLLAEIRKDPGG